MDQKPAELVNKPPLTLYPSPDFSVPPPAIQETKRIQSTTTTNIEKSTSSAKDSSRHESTSSRDRESSRHSPHASSSRDYRSQSRYSSSSRYSSNRDHNTRRPDDYSRDSYKRKRSRSRSPSKSSSRRSPYRPSSSRKSPHSNHDRTSRTSSHRQSPKREARSVRDETKSTRENSRHAQKSTKDPQSERERLLAKWRKNYCETSDQISKKLQEMANDMEEQVSWIRASPADIHYKRTKDNVVESTPRLDALCTLFDDELLKRADNTRAKQTPYNTPNRRRNIRVCRHKCKLLL